VFRLSQVMPGCQVNSSYFRLGQFMSGYVRIDQVRTINLRLVLVSIG